MNNSAPRYIRIGNELFERVASEAEGQKSVARTAAKKKYVERYTRYDKAAIAKWLASVIDKSAQDQEDSQDLIDEISDSDDPRSGQAFIQLLKDNIKNQNHIMNWTLDKLENLDTIAKKDTPDSNADAAATSAAPTV